MNNTKILTMINLLKENKLEELKLSLTQELLNSTDKTKANLLATATKYIKGMDNDRPLLKAVCHKNGKQFLVDGATAYIFDTYREELDNLPQTEEQNSINIFAVLNSTIEYENMNENDRFMFDNISKYIAYYKAQDFYNKNDNIYVEIGEKCFNAKFIETTKNMLSSESKDLLVADCGTTSATQFKANGITAIVLPIRDDEKIKEMVKNTMEQFLKEMKGL